MDHDDLVHALYRLGTDTLKKMRTQLQRSINRGYRPVVELLSTVEEAIDLLDTDIGIAQGGG